MPRLLLALATLFASTVAQANWMLVPSETPASANRLVRLALVFANEGAEDVEVSVAQEVVVKLYMGGRPENRNARVVAGEPVGTTVVPPREFRRWMLELELPKEVHDHVLLEYAPVPSAKTVLVVQRAQEPLLVEAGVNPDYGRMRVVPASASVPAASDPYAIEDDPMYFLIGGSSGTTAKFQVSVKYPIWRPWNIFVGYSQLSVWDLSTESKPFRDNNYRPSVFWSEPLLYSLPQWNATVGLRAGVEHESNGRGGADSRSINIAYIRPEIRKELDGDQFIEFRPKIYNYIDKVENTDIGRYRGYVDWNLRYGSRKWMLGTTIRQGTSGGSRQLDLRWRPDSSWTRNPDEGFFIYSQIFSGYGETLLDFKNRRPTQFRVGIGVVR